jgi:hypothetical protein
MLLWPGRCVCAQPAAPKVEVRGLRVVGPACGEGMEALRAFYNDEGTTLALLVTVPEGGLVSVNSERTQLTRLADDKGTELKAAESAFRMHMGMQSRVGADGKACLIEMSGKGVPAKGANSVTAAGTIYLQCGSRKLTARQENVALTPGAKIAAGPITFEISKVGKPESSFGFFGLAGGPAATPPAEELEVTLRTNKDCTSIASIAFLDAAGKDLGAQPSTSSSVRLGRAMTVEKSFVLPKKVAAATISITYWADLKEVAVPFDVTATLGL